MFKLEFLFYVLEIVVYPKCSMSLFCHLYDSNLTAA